MKNTHYIAVVVLLICLARVSSAQDTQLVAKGRWVEGAAGVQTSGLTFDSEGQLWTVGDQNTKKGGKFTKRRLFRILGVDERSENSVSIGSGRDIFYKSDIYDGDFEAICAIPETNTMFAATESFSAHEPRKPLSLFEFNADGIMTQRRTELDLAQWMGSSRNLNERLEGIAYGANNLFLAYEKPPRILMLSLAEARRAEQSRGGNAITPTEMEVDFSGIPNINGLAFFERNSKEYLVAVSRDQHSLMVIQILRNEQGLAVASLRKKEIKFISPNSDKELCWASPEGITVSQQRLWIISDPAYTSPHNENYRELSDGERRKDCHKNTVLNHGRFDEMVPILFTLDLDELF